MKYLIVVDMQNDFITGSLGTKEAEAILPEVIAKVKNYDGKVIFTKDTHTPEYLSTQEGRNLPVEHCISGEEGWYLDKTLENLAKNIAYKVKRTKRPVSLEPMNPYERRIIHSALQNDKYITTHSEGDEPFRRVVVTLKR